MKKFILTLAMGAVLFSATTTHAVDGIISFLTFNGNDTSKGTVFNTDGTTPVGSSFLGQLYVSSTINGTYSPIGSATAFIDGFGVINGNSATTVTGFVAGDTAFYKLVAWNSAAGSTFEQASVNVSGIVGSSVATQFTVGGTTTGSQPQVIESFANIHPTFSVSVAAVPEPTTIALGVLGGLGLLARRRRNA